MNNPIVKYEITLLASQKSDTNYELIQFCNCLNQSDVSKISDNLKTINKHMSDCYEYKNDNFMDPYVEIIDKKYVNTLKKLDLLECRHKLCKQFLSFIIIE